MRHIASLKLFIAALLLGVPSMAEAGRPLICHPFQTAGAELLPWMTEQEWNTPDPHYDVQRLTADTLRLLNADAPILARMENMRRATIYAAADPRAAEQLLAAVLARAASPHASRLAIFDAGYLVETFRQASQQFGRVMTTEDGYPLVLRAIGMGTPAPEMEFAAALMTTGGTAFAHRERARAGTPAASPLAQLMTNMGW